MTPADEDKLSGGLTKLSEEDPTFRTSYNEETGQTVISGMGELHLDVLVDRMTREFGVASSVGRPQVAYRETIRKTYEAEGHFVRQSGGRGQFGHVEIRLEPREPGSGFEFVNEVKGGNIPQQYITPVRRGVEQAMATGVLAGHPVVDVKVTLLDGRYHEVDSSEMAFATAGSIGFKAAMAKASPVLLEPIMQLEISCPEEYFGDVMGDVTSRRGNVLGVEARANLQIIRAQIPLMETFGYTTILRSMTQGRASSSMEFDHYAEVSQDIVAATSGVANNI